MAAKRRGRPPKRSEGLGDTIEKITEKTGIKKVIKSIFGEDCRCEERKKELNRQFSYKFKPRCLTKEEYKKYKEFTKVRTLTMSNAQIKFVCKLYSDLFKLPYYEPCRNCTPKPLIVMMERIEKVIEQYDKELTDA